MEIIMLDKSEMARLTEGAATKSEKMRILARAGYSRSDIANFLGVKYQFVRNVLVREEERGGDTVPAAQSAATTSNSSGRVYLGSQGEVVLPADARDALGLKAGDRLLVSVTDDEIRLMTIPTAVRKVQAAVRKFIPEDVSLVDELLEDRRREVERERDE
jgi:AbrB family looped-hinge helix DNA binding protein